ncbi:hypothetical protein ACQ86K_13855 [Mucilaginibacter sp. P19]|uniref:hypothetical protein n=1 Tax=Mucilaginibacter sp. P19 TaxID=3423947 RepID=UPI003D6695F4
MKKQFLSFALVAAMIGAIATSCSSEKKQAMALTVQKWIQQVKVHLHRRLLTQLRPTRAKKTLQNIRNLKRIKNPGQA